jgi:hypothetical protein
VQQHLSGAGQGDAAAAAVQQADTKAPLELLDRPGQWWLGHAEALGGAAEVQLLSNGDEVPQLAGLQGVHGHTIPSDTSRV